MTHFLGGFTVTVIRKFVANLVSRHSGHNRPCDEADSAACLTRAIGTAFPTSRRSEGRALRVSPPPWMSIPLGAIGPDDADLCIRVRYTRPSLPAPESKVKALGAPM